MAFEELLTGLTAALVANTSQLAIVAANQERLLAGQAAAIEKIEAGKGVVGGSTGRGRRKASDAAEQAPTDTAPTAEAEQTQASTAATATTATEVTDDDVRAVAVPYLTGQNPTPYPAGLDEAGQKAEKVRRGTFLKSISDNFGTPQLCGEKSTLNADERRQVVFFIKRHIGGGEVNFSAGYDFNGDPLQGAAAAPAAAEDEFDIG